jgi:hypothetical protein
MLCEICGNIDCTNLYNTVVRYYKNFVILDSKDIKVCCACWGWLQSTRKCNGNVVDIEEGKPITLSKVSTYLWGTKAAKQPKKPKTLGEYMIKESKRKKS